MASRFRKGFILILGIFLTLQVFAGDNGKWELIKDSKGVKVFSRPFPGSHYKELRSVGRDVVPFEVAVEFVKDCDAYHEWYGMCRELYVIKKYSESEYDMYFVLDMPVVKDRDLVVKVRHSWDYTKGEGLVTIKSIDSDYKKDSGYVRMPKMDGSFKYRKVEDNKVEVVYQFHAEMGGILPAWVVNIAATKQPFDTGLGIKKSVQKKKYYELASKIHGKEFAKAE